MDVSHHLTFWQRRNPSPQVKKNVYYQCFVDVFLHGLLLRGWQGVQTTLGFLEIGLWLNHMAREVAAKWPEFCWSLLSDLSMAPFNHYCTKDGTLERSGKSGSPGGPVTPGLIWEKRQDRLCSIEDSFSALSQCVGFVALARWWPAPKVHRKTE